jgi:hypothetical protein
MRVVLSDGLEVPVHANVLSNGGRGETTPPPNPRARVGCSSTVVVGSTRQ